jgi:hypothetical protein
VNSNYRTQQSIASPVGCLVSPDLLDWTQGKRAVTERTDVSTHCTHCTREFTDTFSERELSPERWVDHYLPHWTAPERSAARYSLDDGGLVLRIDADQPPWRDEDGGMRVSNIQTATFSGPVGSPVGTHRHRGDLAVRTAVPTRFLYTPASGFVEATLDASPDPTCMLAIWLVGVEASGADDSGEICIAELFGSAMTPHTTFVRLGVKAHNDPRLTTDMVDIALPIDATKPHTYGAAWTAERVHFFVDGDHVRTVEQGLGYPLQVMIDLFEFRRDGAVSEADYPKRARVRSVHGYRVRTDASRATLR